MLKKYKKLKKSKTIVIFREATSSIENINDLVIVLQEEITKALASDLKEKSCEDGYVIYLGEILKWFEDANNRTWFQTLLKKEDSQIIKSSDLDSILNQLKISKNSNDLYSEANNTGKLIREIVRVAKKNKLTGLTQDTAKFKEWIKKIINDNKLDAIVFIWDEFQNFISKCRDLSGFQEHIVGACDSKFYFIPVTHTLSDTKMSNRFDLISIELPDYIAFELIGDALMSGKGRTQEQKERWKIEVEKLSKKIKDPIDKISEHVKIESEKMNSIIPIHPYTALVLKHITEKYKSNQRSLLEFISEDADGLSRFKHFITNNGPDSDDPFLTISYLWEYVIEDFAEKKDLEYEDPKKIIKKYNMIESELNSEEKTVFKAILLMIMASGGVNDAIDILKPTEENLKLAFKGTILTDKVDRIVENLIQKRHVNYNKLKKPVIYDIYLENYDLKQLDEQKDKLKSETTTDKFILDVTLDKITKKLELSLKKFQLRFEFHLGVIKDDFNKKIKMRCEKANENMFQAILCFARTNEEKENLIENISTARNVIIDYQNEKDSLEMLPFIFIEIPMDEMENKWDDYIAAVAEEKLNRMDNKPAVLVNEWLDSIIEQGNFRVWTESPDKTGIVSKNIRGKDGLKNELLDIARQIYPYAPELWFNCTDQMLKDDKLSIAAKFGIQRKAEGIFNNRDIRKIIEEPEKEILKIKNYLDDKFSKEIKNKQIVSIWELFRNLKSKPYGFTKSNICAYLLGFLLKEYVQNKVEYYCVDGSKDEPLKIDNLSIICGDAIKSENESKIYIRTKSEEEKLFSNCIGKIFDKEEKACNLQNITNLLRSELAKLNFPIWVLKQLTNDDLERDVIDKLLRIANTENNNEKNSITTDKNSTKNEFRLINDIGTIIKDCPEIVDKLKDLITLENCQSGMEFYAEKYEGGKLALLSKKIGQDTQYLKFLADRFKNIDASLWVWGEQTTNEMIDEVIVEYAIMDISYNNEYDIKVIINTPSEIKKAWHTYLMDNIKVSYEAIEYYLSKEQKDVLGALLNFTRNESIITSQDKHKFLELIQTKIKILQEFIITSQGEFFNKLVSSINSNLEENQINQLYSEFGFKQFFVKSNEYRNNLAKKVNEYCDKQSGLQLINFFESKTNKKTPLKWSEDYETPLLAFVPRDKLNDAKKYFDILNRSMKITGAESNQCEEALKFVKKFDESWWIKLRDEKHRDEVFCDLILGKFNLILSSKVKEVKELLKKRLQNVAPYDWYSNKQVDEIIEEKAKDVYERDTVNEVVKKIEEIKDPKNFLKELVEKDVLLGIKIIGKGDLCDV
ncbi:MAG: hypothetical protein LBF12_04840 [Christensenellaceae bacterium]|nr:hypothetical protein [Christensenellaceae bacterium]